MTRKEWLYIGAAGFSLLGGILWFAHHEAAANAAAQASDQQAADAISSAMQGSGGLSSYYGGSGSGSYIPEAGQVTSTQPTADTSGSGSSGSGTDPILGFLEAYMTSNGASQQSSLENEVQSLTSQLNTAKAGAGQVSGLQATIQQLTQQLTGAQQQVQQYGALQGQYNNLQAGYQDQQRAIAAYKGIFDQTVSLLHQAQSSNAPGVNKDALNAVLNTPLPS